MITGSNLKKAGLMISALSCAVMITFAIGHHYRSLKKVVRPTLATKPRLPEYDTVLFNKFNAELKSIAVDSITKTFSGVLNITDGRDSLNNARALPFLVSTSGHNRYIRMGTTETILEQDISIVIEHDQKRVILSRQTQVQTNPLDNLQQLKSGLRSDNFALTTKLKDHERVISFVNEHHINCKEFAVAYDTASNKLTRIYARLTDIEDPLNNKKDRVMELKVQRLIYTADLNNYPTLHTIVRQNGENAVLTVKYEGYKLIIL
ncbi:hypothetical protein [Mucilaginibacter sp.]